jgi:Domain of unknown function (DUF4410)
MAMKLFASALLLFACYCVPAFAQSPDGTTNSPPPANSDSRNIKQKYRFVKVDRFELKQGLVFPAEYVDNLQKEITKFLADAKLFQQVLDSGEQPPTPAAPLLRLKGTIHNYEQGSRTARYVGAGLAGTSEIDAQVVLLDDVTGQTLVSKEVRGVLTGGVFGGGEDKATRELAKQIALEARLMLDRRLPPPLLAGAQSPSDQAAENSSGSVETPVLTLNSRDMDASQKRLDEKAAAGYRVADFSLTGGYTAEVQLEQSEAFPGNYQYRVLHSRLFTHLQGEIDKAAAEGFSIVPRTLNFLGPYLVVIMEKPPGVARASYTYRVTLPMRMSSAQKDAEKFQAEGYTLLDAVETPGLHVLVFQKPSSN